MAVITRAAAPACRWRAGHTPRAPHQRSAPAGWPCSTHCHERNRLQLQVAAMPGPTRRRRYLGGVVAQATDDLSKLVYIDAPVSIRVEVIKDRLKPFLVIATRDLLRRVRHAAASGAAAKWLAACAHTGSGLRLGRGHFATTDEYSADCRTRVCSPQLTKEWINQTSAKHQQQRQKVMVSRHVLVCLASLLRKR